MESTKKINILLIIVGSFLCVFHSCINSDIYFNELKKNINKPHKLEKINYNLYKDGNNNIYILSDAIFQYSGKSEEIINKKEGVILQDSIYENNKLTYLKKIIDLNSYTELEKDIFYKDKKYVYMNRGSQYSNYPFFVTEFKSEDFYLFKSGNYFRHNLNIYTYGHFGYIQLDDVDAKKFTVKSIKTLRKTDLILGVDEKNVYRNNEKLSYDEFIKTPLNNKVKDSLLKIYFPDKIR
ncbi:hypothetical protein [Flavobacterium sp.]|uniref:hypothetical protein n=1 Tax=Flavobacterium sp. TaxID=239 RepID=UPI00286DF3E6|nr:hypothetical protein [Flavobacterium sp.]